EKAEGTLFDTVSGIEALIKNVKIINDIENTDLYIYGLNIFNAEEKLLIEEFLKNARSVSIAFLEEDFGTSTNRSLYPKGQLNRFIDFCKNNDIPIKHVQSREQLPEDINFLHEKMFGFNNDSKRYENPNISICKCNNMYDEIKAVASEIQYMVFNKGYRYKDISIVSNNQSYQKIIDTIFDRCNIPHFTDTKIFVKNTILARFILLTLRVLKSGFKTDDLFEYVRHQFSGFSNDDAQFFENYCLKYNIQYLSEKEWSMTIPNTRNKYSQERTNDEANRFESIRKEIYLRFETIRNTDKYCNAAEISNYFLGISQKDEACADIVKNEICFKIIDEFYKNNTGDEDVTLKLYLNTSKIARVIKELGIIYNDKVMSFSDYYNILFNTIENLTFSIVPQYLDNVYIGTSSASVFNKCKALFIVGANEGYFPPYEEDGIILTQKDLEQMKSFKEKGLEIYPSPKEKEIEEKFNILDILTKGEKTYISYAINGTNGESRNRSTGVNEIISRLEIYDIVKSEGGEILNKGEGSESKFKKYYGLLHEEEFGKSEDGEENRLLYYLICPQNCYYELMDGNLPEKYVDWAKEYLKNKKFDINIAKIENKKFDITQYIKEENNKKIISVSEIESFYACPYKFYIERIIGLKEREIGKLKATDTGNYAHKICELYIKKIIDNYKTNKDLIDEKDETIDKLINEAINYCLSEELKDPKYSNNKVMETQLNDISELLKNYLFKLTDMIKNSKFFPKAVERKFGKNDDAPSFEYNGKTYEFHGTVDRIDEYNNNDRKEVLIMDYKTGTIDSKLVGVYTGQKIQLFLYASKYLEDNKKPVGLYYIPIKTSSKNTDVELVGHTLNDYDTINNISNLKPGEKEGEKVNDISSITINAQNKITSKKGLLTEEDIENICKYVLELSKLAINKLTKGYMERNPYDKCKDYCPLKNKCCMAKNGRKVKETSINVNTFKVSINGDNE
ncbi:MAG: PD-(D/E)XK nuclease family protein, partial [Clostridia bacterium]|nr:PD-(D/E)XK nuclease family protein [Clostridia bacterium]